MTHFIPFSALLPLFVLLLRFAAHKICHIDIILLAFFDTNCGQKQKLRHSVENENEIGVGGTDDADAVKKVRKQVRLYQTFSSNGYTESQRSRHNNNTY